MATMQFQKATRRKSKLRLGVAGPAGSGKTTAALEIAKGLGGRIALIDTESGSASLYSDDYDFEAMNLEAPYAPERFIEAIKLAEAAGFNVLVIDSVTPEWVGNGGCNEENERLAQLRYKGNTWSAWSETKPRHRAFVDAILGSRMHVICTIRSKTDTVQTEGGRVKKLGMKMEQEGGFEYEMTVILELDHQSHLAVATKDRTRLFKQPTLVSAKTGEALREWLENGVEAPPTAAEIEHRERTAASEAFAAALNPSGDRGSTEEEHQQAIASSVWDAHMKVRELGEEGYRAVWALIPSDSRAALKKYIDIVKARPPVALANGGVANG